MSHLHVHHFHLSNSNVIHFINSHKCTRLLIPPAICTLPQKLIIPTVINATLERKNHAPLCLYCAVSTPLAVARFFFGYLQMNKNTDNLYVAKLCHGSLNILSRH